jgi:hypothetical protein
MDRCSRAIDVSAISFLRSSAQLRGSVAVLAVVDGIDECPPPIFNSPRTRPQEFDRRRLVLLGFSGCAHDGLVADLESAKATK